MCPLLTIFKACAFSPRPTKHPQDFFPEPPTTSDRRSTHPGASTSTTSAIRETARNRRRLRGQLWRQDGGPESDKTTLKTPSPTNSDSMDDWYPSVSTSSDDRRTSSRRKSASVIIEETTSSQGVERSREKEAALQVPPLVRSASEALSSRLHRAPAPLHPLRRPPTPSRSPSKGTSPHHRHHHRRRIPTAMNILT